MTTRRTFIKQGATLAAVSTASFNPSLYATSKMSKEVGMELCMSYFYGMDTYKMELARQMGVSGAITSAGPGKVGLKDKQSWEYEPLAAIQSQFRKEGLDWKVVEGPPPMDKIKLGLEARDEQIDNFITFIKNLNKLGIDMVCYNWMPVISWHRTTIDRPGRGGALMTAFDIEDIKDQPLTKYGAISAETMWENLEYFLKAVIPEAEKYGVRLAMHPDDPPIDNIRGISRIMTSVDAFKRMIDIVPSYYNGLCFCQGSFATMGEDIPSGIRYFGERDKIVFVHFRDVKGDKHNFAETFHDNGKTDMYEAMKAYYEVGFKGPVRPDHVPTMAGDSNDHPGYSVLGNLYAIGYMKGLIESVEKLSG